MAIAHGFRFAGNFQMNRAAKTFALVCRRHWSNLRLFVNYPYVAAFRLSNKPTLISPWMCAWVDF
jgi:hypothetical protein